MSSSMFALLVVFLVSLWKVTLGDENVIIQRRPNGTDENIHPQDVFTLSPSLCPSDVSPHCRRMGGIKIRNCTCECKHGVTYNESTFGFFDGQWKCKENGKIRLSKGCSVILNNGTNGSPIITVPKHRTANYYVSTSFRNFHIYPATSEYQKCDGSWKYFNTSGFVTKSDRRHIQFNFSAYSSSSSVTGRLIKIAIEHYNKSNKLLFDCVILKVQGVVKCPFLWPTTPIPQTTLGRLSSSSTTKPSKSSTAATNVTNSYSYKPSTKTRNTLRLPTTFARYWTSMPFDTHTQNTSPADHRSLIAGAVSGVTGLFALVIVIILVRRRKKRSSDAKRTGVVAAENNGYEKGEEISLRFTDRVQRSTLPDDEYSYACTNVRNNLRDIDGLPRNQDSQINATNIMYGTIPVSSPSKEAPIYNTLEDPDYANPNKLKKPCKSQAGSKNTFQELKYAKVNKAANKEKSQKCGEPLYNVLEGPEDRCTGGLNEVEAPFYHVVEKPYPEGGPVYDVLEEPTNMVLPPDKISALKMSRPKTDGGRHRGYDDIVYDAVGEVIADTGDIYQQLDQNGQRKPDLYQALTHPNRTAMSLDKLNESHSEA